MEPHRLVNFLYQVATALSRFYGPKENKVIDQDPIGQVVVDHRGALVLANTRARELFSLTSRDSCFTASACIGVTVYEAGNGFDEMLLTRSGRRSFMMRSASALEMYW